MKEDNTPAHNKPEENAPAKAEDKPLPQTDQAAQPQGSGDTTDMPAKPKVKKIWYKNPWFWVGCGALLIGIISITLGLIYRSNVLKTRQVTSDGWFAITTQADSVVVLQNKLSQTKDYNGYSASLHTLDNTIRDQKYNADKLPTWLTDTNARNRYTNFLGTFGAYSNRSAALSDDPSKISTDDISKLTDLSKAAEASANNLKDNASYLQSDMPSDIYKIPDTLQSVVDALTNAQKQTAAQQQAAANAAAQDAANLQAVTTSVTTFENGFIAGNAGAMRPVMTSGFQNEYNFNQLNPDQRQYQYPASFRIITVAKQADGTYKADVNVIYKYTDNSNQYTQGYEYSVILSSGKWLLNNEKQTNSF